MVRGANGSRSRVAFSIRLVRESATPFRGETRRWSASPGRGLFRGRGTGTAAKTWALNAELYGIFALRCAVWAGQLSCRGVWSRHEVRTLFVPCSYAFAPCIISCGPGAEASDRPPFGASWLAGMLHSVSSLRRQRVLWRTHCGIERSMQDVVCKRERRAQVGCSSEAAKRGALRLTHLSRDVLTCSASA